MNRKLAIGILIAVVLLALVIPPYVLLLTDSESTESTVITELRESFYETYGYGAAIVEVREVNPEMHFVFYWENEEGVYASLSVDGLWVIIASTPKQQEE